MPHLKFDVMIIIVKVKTGTLKVIPRSVAN
jgi:hypothetical protein